MKFAVRAFGMDAVKRMISLIVVNLGASVETLPTLGESITSAVIKEWTKYPGDAVSVDDVVCVVETDKV